MGNVTSKQIKERIVETALMLQKKKEIYLEAKRLNKELKSLTETFGGAVGSYGFKSEGELDISMLESEFGEESELNEVEALKKENEELKKKLKEAKK